jgi:hypothetical protein
MRFEVITQILIKNRKKQHQNLVYSMILVEGLLLIGEDVCISTSEYYWNST